jgi:hypothetical protein
MYAADDYSMDSNSYSDYCDSEEYIQETIEERNHRIMTVSVKDDILEHVRYSLYGVQGCARELDFQAAFEIFHALEPNWNNVKSSGLIITLLQAMLRMIDEPRHDFYTQGSRLLLDGKGDESEIGVRYVLCVLVGMHYVAAEREIFDLAIRAKKVCKSLFEKYPGYKFGQNITFAQILANLATPDAFGREIGFIDRYTGDPCITFLPDDPALIRAAIKRCDEECEEEYEEDD